MVARAAELQPESAAAALALGRAPALVAVEEFGPVVLYLLTLTTPKGRRSQLVNLRRVALLLGKPFEAVRWHEMRYDHVVAIKARLIHDKHSPSTVNATLSALRGVALQSWQKGLMSVEDYQRIKAVKGVRVSRVSRHRPREGGEVAALLRTCVEDPFEVCGARDAALLALLCGAGLRRSEPVGLDLSDFDPGTRTLVVRGKGNKERKIFFEDGGTTRLLAGWLELRGAEPGPLLYPVNKGGRILRRRMSEVTVDKAVRRRCRQAGLDPVAPHALRHTFGTLLLDGGALLSDVQQLLGHARVETTLRYDHRDEQSQRRAMSIVSLPSFRRKRTPPGAKRRRGRRRVNQVYSPDEKSRIARRAERGRAEDVAAAEETVEVA